MKDKDNISNEVAISGMFRKASRCQFYVYTADTRACLKESPEGQQVRRQTKGS